MSSKCTDIRPQLKAERDECETQLDHISTNGIQLEVGSSTDAQRESINSRLSEIATFLKDLHRMTNRIDRQPERFQSWLDGYGEWTDMSHVDASADYAPIVEHVAKLQQQIDSKAAKLTQEKAQLEEYALFLRSKQASRTFAHNMQAPTNADLALSGLDASMEWDSEPGLKVTGRRYSQAAGTAQKADTAHHTDFNLASTMLPQLQLPTYDGEPSCWPTFIDSFNAAVDDVPIPPIQKLTILMGCLEGAAKEAVDGFSITGSNYAIVKDVLSERFGDSDHILQTLIMQLIQLPTASSDLCSLRRLQNQVERICRLLESQGQDLNHDQTRVVIESKLPKDLLRKVYEQRMVNPKAYNTALLRKILRTELKIMEASERMSGALDSQPRLKPSISPETVASTANPGKLMVKATPRCRFCAKEHYSSDCTTYPCLNSRREACQSKRLCQACLGDSHQTRQCTAKKRCHYCKQTHVSALCPTRFSTGNVQRHLTLTTTAHSDVLLLSQLTVVSNTEGTRSQEGRVLYDSGSTVSVISNELARALRLTARRKQNMELVTISPYSPAVMPHVEYDVGVQAVNGTVIPLTLVGIDRLPTVKMAQVRSYDNDILETYLSVSRIEPQILIGQADEAKFRLSRIGQTPEGGQLFRTALGYGFSGPLSLAVAPNNPVIRTVVRIEPINAEPLHACRFNSASTQTEAVLQKSATLSESTEHKWPMPQKRKRTLCQFCSLEHWPTDCTTCPDLLSRLQACSSRNLCLNCLSNKHRTSLCTLIKRCRYCQGEHVSALCSVQFKVQAPTESISLPDLSQQAGDNSSITAPNHYAMFAVAQGDDTLLLARRATVANPVNDSTRREAIVLFDSGCSHSLISKRLAKVLKLAPLRKLDLRLATLSDPNPAQAKYQEYEVWVVTSERLRIPLKVIGCKQMPRITAAHVRSFNEADDEIQVDLEQTDPQILVGQADEAKFCLQRSRITDNGGQLFSTILGPAFSGSLPPLDRGVRRYPCVATVSLRPLSQMAAADEDEVEQLEELSQQLHAYADSNTDCSPPAVLSISLLLAPGGDGSELSPTVGSHDAHHGLSSHATQQANVGFNR